MTLKYQTRWRVKRDNDGEVAIIGKRGIIHQFTDGDLDIEVRNTHIVPAIERSGWKAHNHYDDGALFIRPFGDLDTACKYIKAPKRRTISQEQRKALVERLEIMRSGKNKSL